MKKVELLFYTIRSPYDMAHIVQIAESIDAVVYTAGDNCLSFDIPKVQSKVRSWNIKDGFKVKHHYATFEEAVSDLKSQGKYLVGTSGEVNKIFYEEELPTDKDVVLVFGTESTGLTPKMRDMLDTVVKLPMDKSKVDFLTYPVAVSAMAYELYRRYHY